MSDYDQREELHAVKRGCGRKLADGQFFTFCGEMDMGQTDPALCVHCGGELKPAPDTQAIKSGSKTNGASTAMCSMDAHGRLRFAGDRAAIYALQAAVAERYVSSLAIQADVSSN